MATKEPTSITVIGRRWYDGCDTYNTAAIIVDGEWIHTIPFGYGYEDHYLTRAMDWLEEQNVITRESRHESLWMYGARTGCKVFYEAVDVTRRRDLHGRGRTPKN